MNYLAHGYRFIQTPLLLAGTAIPDWLSVVDRKVRLRSHRIKSGLDQLSDDDRQIATGALQHLHDDDRFHSCPTFLMLESTLSVRFRRLMPDPFDHRPPFLGHIVTELLLDAVISEQQPEVLDRYYAALAEVSPEQIQALVNRLATRATDHLALFINRFRDARILYDYQDDVRLLTRLNQVLRRVTLPEIDHNCLEVLQHARDLLRSHSRALLEAVESTSLPKLF
jgi:hypothetical protein